MNEHQLEHGLRLGHPEADRYQAPPFSALPESVSAHRGVRVRRWLGVAAVAAAVVLAVAGILANSQPRASSDAGGSSASSAAGGLSPADVRAIATAAGIDPRAIVVTADGPMATRYVDGQLQVLRAVSDGGWSIRVVVSTPESRPAGASVSAVETIACTGNLAQPVFIYGLNVGMGETQLAIHGLDGVGGAISNGTYLFAAKAPEGTAFWIDGPKSQDRHVTMSLPPDVVGPTHLDAYAGDRVPASTACPGF